MAAYRICCRRSESSIAVLSFLKSTFGFKNSSKPALLFQSRYYADKTESAPVKELPVEQKSEDLDDNKLPIKQNTQKLKISAEFAFKEKFIPISRRSLVKHLLEHPRLLTDTEKKKFEHFAIALDKAIASRYYGLLGDLRSLFDPINPDKDTIETRKWQRRERLDNEFWLLQKLDEVMEKANFYELPKHLLHVALKEKNTVGVRVSVDPNRYDVLRYWVLGKETPHTKMSWFSRLKNLGSRLMGRGQVIKPPQAYYKRVVVAERLRADQKLMLKMFKEVPVNDLEQLLPDGKIGMRPLDRTILITMVGVGATSLLIKLATFMAQMNVQWAWIIASVTGAVGLQGWVAYLKRRNFYLGQLSRMLYFKNVANNRGLITLLVDRAEDETFKEALLSYCFLLAHRPPSQMEESASKQTPEDRIGGVPVISLEKAVEDWIYEKAKTVVNFDSSEANELLKSYGILSVDLENESALSVLPLEVALQQLPHHPTSLISKVDELDLEVEEGYEKDYFSNEEVYKEEDKRNRRYGWF